MKFLAFFAFFLTVSLVFGEDPPLDPCYQEKVNCFLPELEVGRTTYLRGIEYCENACRSLEDCKWFTWREAEDFNVCYFLSGCPMPMNGDEYTSGDIEECQE